MDRVAVSEAVRRRVAIALLVAVALVPVAGIAAFAESSRGLTGEVSHVVSTLTNTKGGASNTPGRLVELGNTRARYWSEGVTVGEHALLKGVGALGYETAVTRYTTDANVVPHAHSFVVQTFADFGLIGIALMVALLTAWVTRHPADADPSRLRLARRGARGTAHDAGRRRDVRRALRDRLDVVRSRDRAARAAVRGMAGRSRAIGRRSGTCRRAPASGGRARDRGGLDRHRRSHAAVRVGACGSRCVAENGDTAAIAAFSAGDARAALDDARTAAARDPLTVDPLFQLAAMYTAIGRPPSRPRRARECRPSPAAEPADVARARRVLSSRAPARVSARPAGPGNERSISARPRSVRRSREARAESGREA